MIVRSTARSIAVAFFASLAAYLVATPVRAWLGRGLLSLGMSTDRRWVIALAIIHADLPRLLILPMFAAIVSRTVAIAPTSLALLLVVSQLGLELAVDALIGTLDDSWEASFALFLRAPAALLTAYLCLIVVRWRRRGQSESEVGDQGAG